MTGCRFAYIPVLCQIFNDIFEEADLFQWLNMSHGYLILFFQPRAESEYHHDSVTDPGVGIAQVRQERQCVDNG